MEFSEATTRKKEGIIWDKQSDSFIIEIPNISKHFTKRNHRIDSSKQIFIKGN